MEHRVVMPFRVTGMAAESLTQHPEAVEKAVNEQDRIGSAAVRQSPETGAVSVQFDVASDDYDDVARTAIRVVKSAVKAAGPEGAWKSWDHDGPTRITAV